MGGQESGTYDYEGVQRPSKRVALFYNPNEKNFTLDRLDSDFLFNLRGTPREKDVSVLTEQHPQLDTGVGENGGQEGHDLFGDSPNENRGAKENTAPDPNNPYDYRHFLNHGGRSPSPAPSAVSSPVPNHAHSFTSPAMTAINPRKQKNGPSKPKEKPQRRHEKARYLSPMPTSETGDEDGETADADLDADIDELVIDLGDSEAGQKKPWRSALGVLNEGPISLRSAASSMSPSVRGESDVEKKDSVHSEEDEDVDVIDLGETAAEPAPPQEDPATPGNGWDDNSDELEAELELALGDQADDEEVDQETGGANLNGDLAPSLNGANYSAPVNHVLSDSSSESEEE